MCMTFGAHAESLFFPDEPVQDGIRVFDVSKTFAEIYEKLDTIKWAGKNINVAVESLENLNPSAHIAATDERVVLGKRYHCPAHQGSIGTYSRRNSGERPLLHRSHWTEGAPLSYPQQRLVGHGEADAYVRPRLQG